MKKKDLIIYFIILFLFILSLAGSFLSGDKGHLVRVYVNREIYAEYAIDHDKEVLIKGMNDVELKMIIENGNVYVSDSNCPDKICVNTGSINKTNESVICLPGKIVISLYSEKESGYDTISRWW